MDLAETECRRLKRFVKTGKAKAREILRGRTLLASDSRKNGKHESDPQIAKELDVCVCTRLQPPGSIQAVPPSILGAFRRNG